MTNRPRTWKKRFALSLIGQADLQTEFSSNGMFLINAVPVAAWVLEIHRLTGNDASSVAAAFKRVNITANRPTLVTVAIPPA